MNELPTLSDRWKLFCLRTLSKALEFPLARGRVSISERVYGFLSPNQTLVEKRIGKNWITLDLSQQELRYIYFGAFEPDERQFLKRFLRTGDIVVDVGANYGYLSAIALDLVAPSGRVFAFEANPSVYKQLQKLNRSAGDSFEPYNLAVCSEKNVEGSTVKFFVNPVHTMWASTKPEFTGCENPEEVIVGAITLADFLFEKKIDRVSLVKIDVEGAEADVLDGLLPFVKVKNPSAILCEVAPDPSLAACNKILEITKLGYGIFRIAKNGFLSEISIDDLKNLRETTNVVVSRPEIVAERIY